LNKWVCYFMDIQNSNEVMMLSNQDLKRLYDESWSHYERKEYDKALAKINEILKIDKNNIPARNTKASILIESWDGSIETKSQISEAIDHLNIAMEIDPNNKTHFLLNKGNAFYKLAMSEFKESVKLNSVIIDHLEKAKSCFQGSLEINEDQPDVLKKIIGNFLAMSSCNVKPSAYSIFIISCGSCRSSYASFFRYHCQCPKYFFIWGLKSKKYRTSGFTEAMCACIASQ